MESRVQVDESLIGRFHRFLLILRLILPMCWFSSPAQDYGFPFGKLSIEDLRMRKYPSDTSAVAAYLNEFGEAYIDPDTYALIFRYHARIKILDIDGLTFGNFSIPLRKLDARKESVKTIRASTFNLENDGPRESKLNTDAIFTEKNDRNFDELKFALPNVRVGSILEVAYVIESPFIFNFWPWRFQSSIPKRLSEFWALIPGNYLYSISMRGYLTLSKNESTIVKECLRQGLAKADCALNKYSMVDVPAFVDEEFMTSKKNFISAIDFELAEVRYFDGRVDRVTREWRDVVQEFNNHENFGAFIRKSRNLLEEQVATLVSAEPNPLLKAKTIYRWMTKNYQWNVDHFGKYAEQSPKKVFEERRGNTGDINLSLVGALQAAGLAAFPLVLSTRDNGTATELHPVISDYNYVVADVEISGSHFMLDATEKFQPFGLLPERCLNGRGRLIAKESKWIDLKPTEKTRTVTSVTLVLNSQGVLSGSMAINYGGYDAVRQREKIMSFQGIEKYRESLEKAWGNFSVDSYLVKALDSLDAPLIEKLGISFSESATGMGSNLYFNPFLTDKINNNPFKSTKRSFPVDFGSAWEKTLIVSMDFPKEYFLADATKNVALVLPQAGGKFTFSSSTIGNRIVISSNMTLSKAVYTSDDYALLKEFFSRVIQTQDGTFVFERR